jgi:hypothetical protein
VLFKILQGRLVFCGELSSGCLRNANGELSMPTLKASTTKCKCTVFADSEQVLPGLELFRVLKLAVIFLIIF